MISKYKEESAEIQFESKRLSRSTNGGQKRKAFRKGQSLDRSNFFSREKGRSATPVTGSLDRQKSYWKANFNIQNLEELKKSGVDREIKNRARLIRKRIRGRRLVKSFLALAFFLSVFLLVGHRSRVFKLSIDVDQNSSYSAELKSEIGERLRGGFFNLVRPPLTRYDSLASDIKANRDELDNLEFKFNFWKMKTEVVATTSTPLVRWASGAGPVFVNSRGKVFHPPASFVGMFRPVELFGSGLEERGDDGSLSDKLIWSVGVIGVMKSQGIEPVRLELNGGSLKRVEVLLAGEEQTRLIFSITEDVERSGESAVRVVRHLRGQNPEGLKRISYLDFRTPDRVVYR